MIMAGMEKSTSHKIATVLTGLEEETHIAALQVVYNASKPGVKTALFYMIGDVSADIIQQSKMQLLLMKILKAFRSLIGSWTHQHDEWLGAFNRAIEGACEG